MTNEALYNAFDSFQMWLSLRTHRERIVIIIVGWIIIFFVWYELFQKPLLVEKAHIKLQIETTKTQVDIFKKESDKVTTEGELRSATQQHHLQERKASKIEWATSSDIDVIIKQLLNSQKNIQFVSLKTNPNTVLSDAASAPTTGDSLELAFNGNYFDTVTYLEQLEKIPWCVTWDSMQYQVTNYPTASIVIHLSIAHGQ